MLTMSTHQEYLSQLQAQWTHSADDAAFQTSLATYAYECVTLCTLSLDPVRETICALYCPTGQGAPYDPAILLRSWLLMTLCAVSSPDAWARRLRREPLLAVLIGATPGHTPCATAHREFLTRLADGPYAVRRLQDQPLSQQLAGRHSRRLDDQTKARQQEAGPQDSQSMALVTTLLAQAEAARDPHALHTRLTDLFVALGLEPSLKAGLIQDPEHVTIAGDGTITRTAASPDGQRLCDCPPQSRCDCPRAYTSRTAQWCKDTHHAEWRFGDRSYTIDIHVGGHDLPLITIMGRGNESDFTLAPKALDELLKTLREHDLPLGITMFVGDGHHDCQAMYLYLRDKGIIPIIPLREASPAPPTTAASTPTAEAAPQASAQTPAAPAKTSKTPRPAIAMYPDITFDPDGTPVCPGGCRLRHGQYIPRKAAHTFSCPAKRKNRQGEWIFYADECPFHKDCRPEKKMGFFLYLKSEADLRLFPPIPRNSARFTTIYTERTSTERGNAVDDAYHVDRACRNAPFALIRLTFVNIAKHARVRWLERCRTQRAQAILAETLAAILTPPDLASLPN